MGVGWMDDFLGDDSSPGEDSLGEFYCPFTDGAECALMTKGWQPQELCEALECDQLKLFQRGVRRRHEAA